MSNRKMGVALCLVIGACGVEPDLGQQPEAEDGLVIAYADTHRIAGTYGENGRGIDFQIERAGHLMIVDVGVRSEMLLESVFHGDSASTTILDRLTFVRTDSGVEAIGDNSALDEWRAVPESTLLDPLRVALRRHGIVDEIVTLP